MDHQPNSRQCLFPFCDKPATSFAGWVLHVSVCEEHAEVVRFGGDLAKQKLASMIQKKAPWIGYIVNMPQEDPTIFVDVEEQGTQEESQ